MKSKSPVPVRSRALFYAPAPAIGILVSSWISSMPGAATADPPDGQPPEEDPADGEIGEKELMELDDTYTTEVRGYRVLPTDETTGFAETIEVKEEAKTMETVSEVVSDSVGVLVKQTGGIGSYGEASIRGSTSAQVPVYLDGMLLNRAGGGMAAVDLGNLSLDTIESIEIYRGHVPVSLGARGIGGAISLKTRSFDRPVTELALTYGSWNTARLMLLRGDRLGRTKALAALAVQGSEGDFVFYNRNGTLFNDDDDTYERRQNNAHFSGASLVKLDGDAGSWQWTVMNDFLSKRQGIAGVESISTTRASSRLMSDITALSFTGPISRRIHGRIDAHYMVMDEDFDDRENEIGTGAQRLLSTSHAVGGYTWLSFDLDRHDIGVRAGTMYERYAFTELFADLEPSPSTRVRSELGLQYDWQPWEAFHLVPSVLFELHNSRFHGGTTIVFMEEAEPRYIDDYFVSPSVGLRWELVDGLVLRANGGRFVRPPDLAELFGNRGVFEGNPELDPEVGINADAGLSFLWTGGDLVKSLRLDAAWFGSWVSDLIVNEQKSQHTFGPENVDAADITGVESSVRLNLGDAASLHGNYTFFHGINESEKPFHNGNQLPGHPRHQAYGKVEGRLGTADWRGSVWIDADYTGAHYLGLANMIEQPARTLFGLGYRLERPVEGMTLTFEIRNLFNTITHRGQDGRLEPITDFMMWPLPGRTALATVHWKM